MGLYQWSMIYSNRILPMISLWNPNFLTDFCWWICRSDIIRSEDWSPLTKSPHPPSPSALTLLGRCQGPVADCLGHPPNIIKWFYIWSKVVNHLISTLCYIICHMYIDIYIHMNICIGLYIYIQYLNDTYILYNLQNIAIYI